MHVLVSKMFNITCDASTNTTLPALVSNFTIFYSEADLHGSEAPLVATSVLMFALAALFVVLNIFSRYSDVSATLNPSARFFFSAALSLFLPAMSYVFADAKRSSKQGEDLSMRARIILMWMLLVELLRKKVEAILLTAAGAGARQEYSAMVQRATNIVWLGNLVFFSLQSTGKKALYGMIWVVVAAKFLQRSVTIEIGKRSFAHGKNPQAMAAYMLHMLDLQQQQNPAPPELRGSELLKHCNYAVMGEDDLIDANKADHKGYKLDKDRLKQELVVDQHQPKESSTPPELELVVDQPKEPSTPPAAAATGSGDSSSAVVTVGRVWSLAGSGDHLLKNTPSLKRLCLSFALFKLLRRRLEGYPISAAEAADCHRLVFDGLLEETAGESEVAFQVFADEVQFLCESYHSVVPVVFASPFFFAHNYVLFPVVVLALCLLVLVLCGNGDVEYAVRSLRCDNFFTSGSGDVVAAARYVLGKVLSSTAFLFCAIDLATTAMLVLAVAYEEASEYVVFLFSNWFVVSLLCNHTAGHEWRAEAGVLRRVIPGVLLVKKTLADPNLAVKQFSLLSFLGRRLPLPLPLPVPLPSTAVPGEAMARIMERLASVGSHGGAALSKGTAALYRDDHLRSGVGSDKLAWACAGGGVAEVMLTWHVATAMLEARCARRQHRERETPPPEPGRAAAMALSGYCAYLVAFRPELLPDDRDGTEVLFKEVKKVLSKEMGWCGYSCFGGREREAVRRAKLMEKIAGRSSATDSEAAAAAAAVLRKGARLGKALIEKYKDGARDAVWKLLGDVWTELVVYAAPTAGELHVKAHKEALAQGAELITVLWAITTHTGIARPSEEEEEQQQYPPPPAALATV